MSVDKLDKRKNGNASVQPLHGQSLTLSARHVPTKTDAKLMTKSACWYQVAYSARKVYYGNRRLDTIKMQLQLSESVWLGRKIAATLLGHVDHPLSVSYSTKLQPASTDFPI